MALFSISEDTPVGKTEVYCYRQIFSLSIYQVFTHRGDDEFVAWGLELQLITVIPCGLKTYWRKATVAKTQLASLCGVHAEFRDILLLLLLLGTQVYVLNGTDPEGDPVRYGLMFEKGSKEYFKVDSKSGNVSLIQELDREVNLHIFWF